MAKHHHLVIAGTGRAGTSFLVRYLSAAGLDTIVSRQGEKALWNEQARAGFEDPALARGDLEQSPYVVKSPWLYEHVEEFFGRDDVQIDGLILPIRKLEYAACSRVIVERQAIHRAGGFPGENAWGSFGITPGGLHVSLEPIDQARLLATGFHKVVEAAVRHDVPMTLLDFARLTQDARYLFEKLRPHLPPSLSAEAAAAIHDELAKGENNRTEDELSPYVEGVHLRMPASSALDNAALKREMARAHRDLQAQHAALSTQAETIAELERRLAGQSATAAVQAIAAAEEREQRAREMLASYQAELEAGKEALAAADEREQRAHEMLASYQAELDARREALAAAEEREQRAREMLASYQAEPDARAVDSGKTHPV
jgi:hypothetical protein